MKSLINSKDYQKALDLFEEETAFATDVSFNMAIKACTELRQHERGLQIIKHLPSHSLHNYFIQTSLIRFYSKLFGFVSPEFHQQTVVFQMHLIRLHLVQCHDSDSANRIFFAMTNKTNVTYTVMFQGSNRIK